VDPRAGLNAVEQRKILHCRISNPGRPARSQSLYRLSYPDSSKTGEKYKLRSSALCGFLQRPLTSSLFGPNILLRTLFYNTVILCSPLNARDEVSQSYKPEAKVLCRNNKILILREFKIFTWSAGTPPLPNSSAMGTIQLKI
jgi:hypothetical protein